MIIRDSEIQEYLGEIKKGISEYKSTAEEYYSILEVQISEYIDENPNASMEDVKSKFGNSDDIVNEFLSEMQPEEIKTVVKKKRYVKLVVIIAIIVMLIALGIFAYEILSKQSEGYFVEKIVDHGDVSSSPVIEEYILEN